MLQQLIEAIQFSIAQDTRPGENTMIAEIKIGLNIDYMVEKATPEMLENMKKILTERMINNVIVMGRDLNEEMIYERKSDTGEQTGAEEDTGTP